MLPKLENKTQTGPIVYIVLLIINWSTYMYNIYSVQQNKAYTRLNIARQQSSCSSVARCYLRNKAKATDEKSLENPNT